MHKQARIFNKKPETKKTEFNKSAEPDLEDMESTTSLVMPISSLPFSSKFNSGQPPRINQNNILGLQSSLGNRAVNRLLASQRGLPGTKHTRPEALANKNTIDKNEIQRKFGLEVEMQVAVTNKVTKEIEATEGPAFKPKKVKKNVEIYSDPLEKWNGIPYDYPKVGEATHFEVKVDHKPNVKEFFDPNKPVGRNNDTDNTRGAIAELVTKPMDENLTENEVETRMQTLVNFANNVDIGNNGRRQLNTIAEVNAAPNSVYIGMDSNLAGSQKKTGEIQATYGIRLDRVNTQFSWKAKKAKALNKDNPKIQIWEQGVANANDFMAAPPVAFSPGITQADKDELKGFITLVSNYFKAKAISTGIGWGKNHLGGYFYKSKLNDVRNSLANPILRTWLQVNANAIADDLINKAGVAPGDIMAEKWESNGADPPVMILIDSNTCKQWALHVLNGTGDLVYEANKNPYVVNPLGPEPVGPTGHEKTGAIMENRNLSAILGGGAYPPGEWVALAKKIHKLTKTTNATAAPTEGDLNASIA